MACAVRLRRSIVIAGGVAEILGGLGLLAARAPGEFAGLGADRPPRGGISGQCACVALLPGYMEGMNVSPAVLWARLPFQAVFIIWVWWVALRRNAGGGSWAA